MNVSSVDVPVVLLGYGTVGSAVEAPLDASADESERATGHRLRVVRALVRDPARERPLPACEDVLTEIGEVPGTRRPPSLLLVVSDAGRPS